ncbi:DUF2272 domain-containing protein [Hoeflea sp. TYP-13]|uniref:DUF2272 domain-containing protein n=1 Tax=Hoeflea sp. TYP-13 TaxID=3230023 RepID=UPI0034C68F1A
MRALDTWRDTTPHIDCFKSEGIGAVGRYYSKNTWKTLKKPEADALSKNGIKIWVVYQDAQDAYQHFSKSKGVKAAGRALEYARDVIGQPTGSGIYFAVDFDASDNEIDGAIKRYFVGVNDVFADAGRPYRIGVYGNGACCQRLLDLGLVELTWLNMSTGHNGHDKFYKSKQWSLRQRTPKSVCTISVDPNELSESGDFGGFLTNAYTGETGTGGDPGDVGCDEDTQTAYVNTEGLNFRKKPNGAIIRALTIGEKVTVVEDANVPGWQKVRIGGNTGYVFAAYLRDPAAHEAETLVANTIAEWVRFQKGTANEKSHPYYEYVGEMWKSIGLNYDGRSVYPDGRDVPWSAAFISFVVRKSGDAYRKFRFAAGHSKFAHDAIQARILGHTNRPFWGYRITEKKPKIGDIIHRNRGGNSYSYDYAEDHSSFNSHSDIVVEVRKRTVRVIGGNVGDTVSIRRNTRSGNDLQEYSLSSDGYIEAGQNVISLLKNRAHKV